MALLDRPLLPLDDRKVGLINAALKSADPEGNMLRVSALATAARQAMEAGQPDDEQALGFAARVLSIHIEGLDPKLPPSVVAVQQKSKPSPAELEGMRALARGIDHPGARARIADLLWQMDGDHGMARQAVESYLSAGAVFEAPDTWTRCTHQYHRALQLAATLGKRQPLFADTLRHVEAALQKHGPVDTSFLSRELMEALFDHKRQDEEACAGYSSMAESIALRLESQGEHFRAREYWAAKEKWAFARKDADDARKARVGIAESCVKEAEQELGKPAPSSHRAAHFLRQAIGILDKLQPESRPRIAALRTRLAELSPQMEKEQGVFSVPFDVSDIAAAARARVEGKPLSEALFALANITAPPNRTKLEADTREAMKGFLQYLFPLTVTGPNGTVVAGRAGVDLTEDPDRDPLFAEMVHQAQLYYGVSAFGSIEPARQLILRQQDVREHHFAQIAYASSFVPPGREHFFTQGLHAGMQGDFLTALHLLVPQLENSFRFILRQHGENTVKINRAGFDEEKDLDELLRLPRAFDLFGDNLCFSLRALLFHRLGPNLRNRLAHGLLEPEEAASPQSVYVWWLTLLLCCAPIQAASRAASAAATEKATPDREESGMPAEPSTDDKT